MRKVRGVLWPFLLPGIYLGLSGPVIAVSGGDICVLAAQEAARETGVPLTILHALSLTETGREQNGIIEPWPWAMNVGGKSYWFSTRAEATSEAELFLASGRRNLDLGCFQINHRWHSRGFVSLEAMIDPKTNARYAARLMAQHYALLGDWVEAAGAYHSTTEEHAARYRAKFSQVLGVLTAGSTGPSDLPLAHPPQRGPLFTSGPHTTLLALDGPVVPLIGP